MIWRVSLHILLFVNDSLHPFNRPKLVPTYRCRKDPVLSVQHSAIRYLLVPVLLELLSTSAMATDTPQAALLLSAISSTQQLQGQPGLFIGVLNSHPIALKHR